MAEAIEVRRFEEPDLPAVLEVLRLSLGEPPGLTRNESLFAWKHFDNPFGRSLLLVAEEAGRIAGFRAFMRWELVGPQGVRLRCVRAVDTATHPEFQRRGVFRQLTLAGIEHATADGVDLIFNTPNQKSGPGYLTMGWVEVGAVGVMVRPNRRLLSRGTRATWEPGALGASPAALIDAVDLMSRPPQGWRTPRTAEYLQWRFGSHPTARYLLSSTVDSVVLGRANMRNDRRELVVSEIGGSGRALGPLIKSAGPDYAVAWFSSGAPERKTALRNAMVPVPRVRALTLMARPLRDLDVDLSWSKWDLSLGDLELL